MFRARATRRISSWIAILSILVGSLAPAVSHALKAGDGAAMEVCTALGAKLVSVNEAQSGGSAPAPAAAMEHCPYCSLQAHMIGLPPVPVTSVFTPLLSFDVPLRFLEAPRTPYAWLAALPRAPPVIS